MERTRSKKCTADFAGCKLHVPTKYSSFTYIYRYNLFNCGIYTYSYYILIVFFAF